MFLRKFILIVLFMGLMYYGGAGTQSDSMSLQGLGFTGVILAFVVLYLLFRIMWTAVSFIMGLAIVGCIIAFIMYCLGMFGENSSISNFMNMKLGSAQPRIEYAEVANTQPLTSEVQNAVEGENSTEALDMDNMVAEEKEDYADKQGFFGRIVAKFDKGTKQQKVGGLNLADYPITSGRASVVTGSVLLINGIYVKLLGVDAPNIEQTCSNSRGQAYRCGKNAVTWLQDWLGGQTVDCYILGNIVRHRATGICFLGEHDIGAAVVGAGWAVAYTKNTDVYLPYEQQARAELKGLWNGRFYRPSDWRKLQTRRAKVEFNNSSSDWFNFDGWF